MKPRDIIRIALLQNAFFTLLSMLAGSHALTIALSMASLAWVLAGEIDRRSNRER